jgi:hypothetical protein
MAECCHPALQSKCETMCKYDCGGILSMKVFEAGSSRRVARDAGRGIPHFPLTPYLKIEASSCDGQMSHHDTACFRPVTDPCLYNIRRCRISCECRRGRASAIRYEHDGRVLRPWRSSNSNEQCSRLNVHKRDHRTLAACTHSDSPIIQSRVVAVSFSHFPGLEW